MVLTTRRKVILAAVVTMLAIAVPAAANHVFSDVPATETHHDSIGELSGAGITTGCAPDRYCPGTSVTRGQMATFLTRAGSTAHADASTTVLEPANGAASGVPVTVAVPGPGSGGAQNVVMQGTVTVYGGSASGCPCEVEAFVYRASDDAQSASSWAVLPAQPSSGASVSLPVTWAVPQSSATDERYDVAVFVEGTSSTSLRADASLTAVTAPFGDVAAP